ncbi:MAG: DsbA family protein [Bryobacteraceae bacterium]
MRLLATGLLLSSLAFAQTSAPIGEKKSFLDKPTLEAYVRHLFVWPAQITVSISDPKPSSVDGLMELSVTGSMGAARQVSNFYVSKNGEKVIQGVSFDVKENPFKANLDGLKTTFAPGIGASGAPVVVVIFSDFQCPHCKEEAKMLRANLTQTFTKEVRAYFKDFPLEQIHNWAKPAAIAGRCIYREDQAKFWDFHDWAFDKQEQLTLETFRAKLETFLVDKKIVAPPVLQCFDGKATEADVNKSFAEGRALEVTSTPTLFVNGRKLAGNLSWPQLKQIIEFEIEYQKTAKNAGENCGCELTLPSVLPK